MDGNALPLQLRDGEVLPLWLGPADRPWLREMLAEYERTAGAPLRERLEALRTPLVCPAPGRKLLLARRTLDALCRTRLEAPIPPRQVRAALFGAAAALSAAEAVAAAAAQLGVRAEAVPALLFADLPGERLADGPPPGLAADELALRANLALAQALLHRASEVRIELTGSSRAVVRHAHLRGLLCTLEEGEGGTEELRISGPLGLFRHTLLYGRALGELLPILGVVPRYRLRASCLLGGELRRLVIAAGDPIFTGTPGRAYDSQLEERFAREFGRVAPDWHVIREPAPVAAAGSLIFPDFALVHRRDPGRSFLLEICGFWTPVYLETKLRRLRAAGLCNLVLCLDERRACADGELPASARIVRFRRRIDPLDVLRALEGEAPGAGA